MENSADTFGAPSDVRLLPAIHFLSVDERAAIMNLRHCFELCVNEN